MRSLRNGKRKMPLAWWIKQRSPGYNRPMDKRSDPPAPGSRQAYQGYEKHNDRLDVLIFRHECQLGSFPDNSDMNILTVFLAVSGK